LSVIWEGIEYPLLMFEDRELKFSDIAEQSPIDLSDIKKGDVVALIGDFNPSSIHTLLRLIDLGTIVLPLTTETKEQHDYFFESALVDVIIKQGTVKRRIHEDTHELIDSLRKKDTAGLIAFTSGTTGRPKAILHDFNLFLKRFETPRQSFRTLNFLMFDHVGGLNTLFHTLFNKGAVIAPRTRTVESILEICEKYQVEVLPTTPTFLRIMLISGLVPMKIPASLKIITYGTELMDQPTLEELCKLLPNVDFRQTFGISELGVFRVKSKARDSLYMKIGGEGIETKVVDGVLKMRSKFCMLGYLNTTSPFDADGWYDTQDIVEEHEGYYKVVGRIGDVINVAGLKFMASEVERVALTFPNISLVKVYAKHNPITGQHVEMIIQPNKDSEINLKHFKEFLKENFQSHMMPKRIHVETVAVSHRYKKM